MEPNGTSKARGAALFVVTLPLCLGLGAAGVAWPDVVAAWGAAGTRLAFGALDWFFMMVVSGFLVLGAWLALGPHRALRLGDHPPEFSTLSWLAMLFAAGMGTGLVFWGAGEPLLHYANAPGAPPRTPEAAQNALVWTSFHWGLHAWGVYCIAGLVLAYFAFVHGSPYLPGAPIRVAFPSRWASVVGGAGDLIAVLAIALGVAGSLAMGTQQIRTGLHLVIGSEAESRGVAVAILVALVAAYLLSAGTGLRRGIRWLSNLNVALAISLMVVVLAVGPTTDILAAIGRSAVDYALELVPKSLVLRPEAADRPWFEGWTLTYFIWWIAWAPFVGVFIARISRGRTIRELVIGVIAAPVGFTLLWFGVFGATALHAETQGRGGLVEAATADVTRSLFALLATLPLGEILGGLAIALVFVFLVTSVDSATFVLGMITSHGSLDPPATRKLAWGVVLGILGGGLTLAGDYAVVRAVAVLGAIPFTFILLLQAVALVRRLAAGDRAPTRTGAPTVSRR